MVAGKPVLVQSPASQRFLHAVVAAGRLAFSPGVAAKVARRSRTICHGGSVMGRPATAATSCHSFSAKISRGTSSKRSAALIVTDNRSGKANSHSIVPLTIPIIGASPGGGASRKCALTMAQNCDGVSRPGTRAAATTDPAAVLASPMLGNVCARIVERARGHFATADNIMVRSPRRCVRAPRIMGEAYRMILDSLVARGWAPPRRPIRLPRARLLWIIMRHAFI